MCYNRTYEGRFPARSAYADYLSAVVVALSGFGFFNVIVTFTLSTAVWLSIAFAKSCKAFFIASTLLTSFAFLDYIVSYCIRYVNNFYAFFQKKF